MSLRQRIIVSGVSGIAFLALLGIGIVHQSLFPAFQGTVNTNLTNVAPVPVSLPFVAKNQRQQRYTIQVEAEISRFSPRQFYVVPDDCLQEVWINEQRINDAQFTFCDIKGRILDFSPYVQRGQNTFRFVVDDRGGWANLFVSPAHADTTIVILRTFFFGLILLYGLFLCRFFRVRKTAYVLFLVVLGTAALWSLFDFEHVQSNSATVDHEYIYSLDAFAALQGYPEQLNVSSAYAPPLYDWLANSVVRGGILLGRPPQLLVEDLYRLNWLFMVMGGIALLSVANILFSRKTESMQPALFVAVLLCTPGIGYWASATSGIAGLWFAISTILAGLLARWVDKGQAGDLLLAIIAVNLAILTHVAGLAFIVALLAAFLIRRGQGVPPSLRRILMVFALMGVVLVWLLYLRNNDSFVVNIQNILRERAGNSTPILQSALQIARAFFDLQFANSTQITNSIVEISKQVILGRFYLQSTFAGMVYMAAFLARALLLLCVIGAVSLFMKGKKSGFIMLTFLMLVPFSIFLFRHWFGASVPLDQVTGIAAASFAYAVICGIAALPRRWQWAGRLVLTTYMATSLGVYYLFF